MSKMQQWLTLLCYIDLPSYFCVLVGYQICWGVLTILALSVRFQESVFDSCGITVPSCWVTLLHPLLYREGQTRSVMLQIYKQKS